ncbi:MAG: hypothetical protein OEL55_04615, partial [Desulfobulbaceae bacterium]|nr:hypothetical protein [Desulfobulbaceae bacterium]
NLDPLERPVIISGGLEAIEAHCRQEQGLRFDVIPVRGLKRELERNDNCLARLGGLLAPQGRLVGAESLPRFQQRLYRLIPQNALDSEISAILAQTEELIYADPDLDWCEEEGLREMYGSASLSLLGLQIEKSRHQVYISRNEIDNWFTPRAEGEKAAYCQHLAANLDEAAIAKVKNAFVSHLQNKVCRWESAIAYLVLAGKQD